MESTIEDLRKQHAKREILWAVLRSKWFNKSHPLSQLLPVEYNALLSEVRDDIRVTEDLLLYLRLNGFIALDEDCPMVKTPLYYWPCPRIDHVIPSDFYADSECYDFQGVVAFIPPCDMRMGHGDDTVVVTPRHLLVWRKEGSKLDQWTIEGGGRSITVRASSFSLFIPTQSTDLVLPLGVIATNLVTMESSKNIQKIGEGLVSWSPITIRASRGGIPLVIEWRSGSGEKSELGKLIPTREGMSINHLLLDELQSLITLEVACRIIEAVLWEGRQLIYRPTLHRWEKERGIIIQAASQPIDRVALIESSSTVRNAEDEYRKWEEVKRYWRH